jgi:hypothetical protein
MARYLMRQQKEPDEAKRLRLAHYRQGQEQAIKSGAAKLIGTDYAPKTKPEPEWIVPYQAKILAMDFSGVSV